MENASITSGKRIWLELGAQLGFTSDIEKSDAVPVAPPSRIEFDPNALPGGIARGISQAPESHISGIPEEIEIDETENEAAAREDRVAHDSLHLTTAVAMPLLENDMAAQAAPKHEKEERIQTDAANDLVQGQSDYHGLHEDVSGSGWATLKPHELAGQGLKTHTDVSGLADTTSNGHSRSPTPVGIDADEFSSNSRSSRRSSVRARASVNYALPKLNTKMRKPDSEGSTPASGRKSKSVTTLNTGARARPEGSKERDVHQATERRAPNATTQRLRPSRSCEGLSANRRSSSRSEAYSTAASEQHKGGIIGSDSSDMEVDDGGNASDTSDSLVQSPRSSGLGGTLSELFETEIEPRPGSVLDTSEDDDEEIPTTGDTSSRRKEMSQNALMSTGCIPSSSDDPPLIAANNPPKPSPSHPTLHSQRSISAEIAPPPPRCMSSTAASRSRSASSSTAAQQAADGSSTCSALSKDGKQGLKRSTSSQSTRKENEDPGTNVSSSKLPASLAELASEAMWPSTPQVGQRGGLESGRLGSKKVAALSKFHPGQQPQRLSKAQSMGVKKLPGQKVPLTSPSTQHYSAPGAPTKVQQPALAGRENVDPNGLDCIN